MLPILRILPVGGVLLAILILVLALKPPGTRPLPLSSTVASARGPLLDRNEHPEWRHVLIQSALRRADELIRLRDLPDTPVRSAPPAAAVSEPIAPVVPERTPPAPADEQKIVGLPTTRLDADPDRDSITGSIDETPGATIPVEIGASSSSELPVVTPEEQPPVIRTPVRAKPPNESRRKRPNRVTRAKTSRVKQTPAQLSFFEALFSGQKYEPQAGGGAQTDAAIQVPRHPSDTH